MHANEFDLLVIGEGLAGICAAAAAARSGMRIMLASKGPGNFVLGTACVNLDGITSGEPAALDCSPKRLEEGLAFFVDLCAAAGCAYDGGILEQRLIPTVMGTFQTASFAPRSLWNGDPRTVAKVAVIGIDNLSAFDADFVAERLYFHTQQKGLSTSYRSANIRLQDVRRPLTTVDVATHWDRDPAYRTGLVDSLRNAVRDAEVLLLPGILGVKSSDHDFRELEETIGCAICELPTMPPSVPGLRLLHRLEDHLIGLGVELCTGFTVQRLCLDGDRCIGVELNTPGRPRTIRAGSVVLASGCFSNLLESCELGAPHSRETMQVDHEFHPLNSKGEVVANNLFACGSGLGSGEPRHGNAVAIITGYQAAMIASQTGVEYAAR